MGKSSPGKRNNVSSWRKILPASARRLLGHLAQTIGLRAGGSRKVRFQASTSVFEFERQLLGGGGVPDGDTVALGLGPKYACLFDRHSTMIRTCRTSHSLHVKCRCVNTSVVPLTDKDDKDEYGEAAAQPLHLVSTAALITLALPPTFGPLPLCFSVHRLSGRQPAHALAERVGAVDEGLEGPARKGAPRD